MERAYNFIIKLISTGESKQLKGKSILYRRENSKMTTHMSLNIKHIGTLGISTNAYFTVCE